MQCFVDHCPVVRVPLPVRRFTGSYYPFGIFKFVLYTWPLCSYVTTLQIGISQWVLCIEKDYAFYCHLETPDLTFSFPVGSVRVVIEVRFDDIKGVIRMFWRVRFSSENYSSLQIYCLQNDSCISIIQMITEVGSHLCEVDAYTGPRSDYLIVVSVVLYAVIFILCFICVALFIWIENCWCFTLTQKYIFSR